MISFQEFKEKELHLLPLRWLAWLSPLVIIAVLGAIFLGPSIIDSYLSSHSHTEVCTVNSAEYDSIDGGGSNGPASSASVDVSTSCGDFTIIHIDQSGGMNHAALVDFFNAHQGQKFEFIIQPPSIFSRDGKSGVSRGITSTTPVE